MNRQYELLTTFEFIDLLKKKTLSSNLREDPSKDLKGLQTEFYYRFAEKLYGVFLSTLKKYPSEIYEARDLLHEVFIIAFEYIDRFKLNKNDSEKDINRSIYNWLITISLSILNDRYNKKFGQIVSFEMLPEKFVSDLIQIEDELPQSEKERQMEEFFNSLTPSEQEVISAYSIYNCLGNSNHFPKELLPELQRRLKEMKVGFSKESIRTKVSRTLKKLEQRFKG